MFTLSRSFVWRWYVFVWFLHIWTHLEMFFNVIRPCDIYYKERRPKHFSSQTFHKRSLLKVKCVILESLHYNNRSLFSPQTYKDNYDFFFVIATLYANFTSYNLGSVTVAILTLILILIILTLYFMIGFVVLVQHNLMAICNYFIFCWIYG